MYNNVRLPKELLDLKNKPIESITVEKIDDNDLFHWKATIKGPNESKYKDQIFNLNISFKNDYPFSFPDFIFTTNIDHPNFHINEKISLNILKIENWTPFISIRTILLKIYSLLKIPLIESPQREPGRTIKNIHRIEPIYRIVNIRRRIQLHFIHFLIEFLNDILKNLNINERFYRLDTFIISTPFLEKNQTLAEIICNDNYRFNPKFYNRDIYENFLIRGNEVIVNLLNENCLTIFKKIYYNNSKIINLKKYGLNKLIFLSGNIRTFKDLIYNKEEKYSNFIKEYIKKYLELEIKIEI